jgi:hypothetical protein
MIYGNQSLDDGNLLLSSQEYKDLEAKFVGTSFIRKFIGSKEFINNINRYCIWIEDDELEIANNIPEIQDRIKEVKKFRLNGGQSVKSHSNHPHQFGSRNVPLKHQLIIPLTSSINRKYIPVGFLDESYIVSQTAQVIFDCDIYVLGIISSHIHMVWLKTVAGRLKTDYRYSSKLCYNTFPFPEVSEKQKEQISLHVLTILEEREKHPEKSLADLYKSNKMPKGLKEAHHQLDLAIERCYRLKPFDSDTERLEYLFKEYEKMINKNTLLEKPKTIRKKKA